VRFAIITPALLHMLATLERLSRELFGLPDEGLVITSGSDGQHMAGSKHYTGEAFDLRTKTLNATMRSTLMRELRRELGPQFTVLLEDAGTSNEHAHVQVKKGATWPAIERGRPTAARGGSLRAKGRTRVSAAD
jgi:hypothetical protein